MYRVSGFWGKMGFVYNYGLQLYGDVDIRKSIVIVLAV